MKRSRKPDVFPIVLAFAVAVFVWFARSLHDFFVPQDTMISVPTFIGQNESDAVALSNRDELDPYVVERRSSATYSKGIVISQDPAPKVLVRAGRRVAFVISTGQEIITMPDLRYRSMREVALILSKQKLHQGKVRYVTNDDIDAGHVVTQDPVPLTPVPAGSMVDLSISRGLPPSVAVPDFIGLQIDDARDAADLAHLRLGQIVWTPFGVNGPPRGVVVRQKPAEGEVIDPRSTVSLQVSAGPNQYGYIVREVREGITVPLGSPSAHFRIVSVDAMGSRPIYDAFNAAGQHLDITTTTVGPAEVDTYLNGDLVDKTVIAHEAPMFEESAVSRGVTTTVSERELGPTPRLKRGKN